MKKFRNIISVFLAITIIASVTTTLASEKSTIEERPVVSVINEPYEFPVTPDDPEWALFDKKEDMLEVCQIPDKILKNMTTEALLETVLNYPFLTDYYAFNNYEDAAKTFENDFNGFRELYSRDDLTEVLLQEYEKTNVVVSDTSVNSTMYYNVATSEEVEQINFFDVPKLEFLIAYDQLANNDYTTSEAEKFDELLIDKMKIREENNELTANSEIYLNFMMQSDTSATVMATTTATVKTPKGSTVNVLKHSPDLSAAEKNSINAKFDKAYPKAVRKATATTNYNCHSYAWYSQNSSTNKYWMNNPSKYWQDGSYKKSTDIRPRVSFRAYYYNGDHSAIVKEIKVIDGAQTFWYQSKWGSAGLYYHSVYYCPYDTGVRHYYPSAT